MGAGKKVRDPGPADDMSQLFYGLEKMFLGENQALVQSDNRFGRLLGAMNEQELEQMRAYGKPFIDIQQQLREHAIQGDPLAKAQRDAALGTLGGLSKNIMGGLEGWEKGELPADIERNIMESVRGSGAARGLLESPTEAINESVRLMGGRENLRSNRLNQAMSFLGGSGGLGYANVPGGTGHGISSILDPIMTGFPSTRQATFGAASQNSQQSYLGQQQLGQGFGQLGGSALSALPLFFL